MLRSSCRTSLWSCAKCRFKVSRILRLSSRSESLPTPTDAPLPISPSTLKLDSYRSRHHHTVSPIQSPYYHHRSTHYILLGRFLPSSCTTSFHLRCSCTCFLRFLLPRNPSHKYLPPNVYRFVSKASLSLPHSARSSNLVRSSFVSSSVSSLSLSDDGHVLRS